MGESTWIKTAGKLPAYPALSGDLNTDVAVIGGGITGITLAYLLAKSGKRVALVTDKTAADTATAYTTGFLVSEYDTAYADLRDMYGDHTTDLLSRAHRGAVGHIAHTVEEEGIECEFTRCDEYTYAPREDDWKALVEEAEAMKRYGFDVDVRKDSKLPFANFGYLAMRNQAKFHALKYISALKEIANNLGVAVFDNTEAIEVKADGAVRSVVTKNGTIKASDVVITTYYPFTKPKQLFAHTGGYTTYVIEYSVPKGAIPEAMYLDEHNPYHYFRVDSVDEMRDRLIVGGEDHREEIHMQDKSFRALEEYIHGLLPYVDLRERTRWTGPIIEPIDGLPFIGPLAGDPHTYVATGYAGTGLSLSRVAAEIVRDQLLGNGNLYGDIFRPDRVPTPYQLAKKGKDYIGEFFGGAGKNMLK